VSRSARSALLALALGVVAACGGAEQASSPPPPAAAEDDPGFGHVHGLGVNPADGMLYAATHYGVWRIPPDGGDPIRIAGRYQDTMGFTVAGPDRFLASGHPDPREDLPSHLGLLESTDRAETWTPLSLLGEADFHALDVENDRVYGYDATSSTFLTSDDGRSWERGARVQLADFSVSPEAAEVVLATTPEGLARSEDGGSTFAPVPGPAELLLVDWNDSGLYGVDASGGVWRSDDGGASWQGRGEVGSPGPAALHVAGNDRVYVAADDGIRLSTDGGRTFRPIVAYGTGPPGGTAPS
jgi:hypothetical protein